MCKVYFKYLSCQEFDLLNKTASVTKLNVLDTKDFCSDLLVFGFCDALNRFVLSCWRQGLLWWSIILFVSMQQRVHRRKPLFYSFKCQGP